MKKIIMHILPRALRETRYIWRDSGQRRLPRLLIFPLSRCYWSTALKMPIKTECWGSQTYGDYPLPWQRYTGGNIPANSPVTENQVPAAGTYGGNDGYYRYGWKSDENFSTFTAGPVSQASSSYSPGYHGSSETYGSNPYNCSMFPVKNPPRYAESFQNTPNDGCYATYISCDSHSSQSKYYSNPGENLSNSEWFWQGYGTGRDIIV